MCYSMNEMGPIEKQKSQSGQALVEYVLLLVIAIALVLGLANQFYKPLGSWVENQMGPYLECLLDIGELPALGGEAMGECAESYRAFAGKGGTAGSGGANGKNAKNGNSSESQNKKDEADKKSSSAAGSEGSGGAGGRKRGLNAGGHRGADGGKGTGSSEVMTEKLAESKFYKFRSNSSSSVQSQQQSLTSEQVGTVPIERLRASKKENASYKAGILDQSEGEGKPQRMIIKPSERKIAADEVTEPWSFGKYLKFALILIIIVAIVLFLAGQVSQISKSMEK